MADSTIKPVERFAVDCSRDVLEEARRLAVSGLVAFSHGGREVGGLLYGERTAEGIRVVSAAELPCEHALGPRFILSENDRQTLESMMHPPDGRQVVGWFRAHTRCGLELDAHDKELFEKYFAGETNIGLILKPSHWGPAEAALYVRESTGEVLSPGAFDLQPLKTERAPEPEHHEPEHHEPERPLSKEIVRAEAPAEVAVLPVEFIKRKGSDGRAWVWASVGVAVLSVAGAAAIYLPHSVEKLGLQAYATAPGMVRIDWDHRSHAVTDGASGVLEIRDGDTITGIPLDSDRMRSSTVTYEQRTAHLTVQLRINGPKKGAGAQETVDFVGQMPPANVARVAAVAAAPIVTPEAPPPVVAAVEKVAAPPAVARPPVKAVSLTTEHRPVVENRPLEKAAPVSQPVRHAAVDADRFALSAPTPPPPALPAAPAVSSGPAHVTGLPDVLTTPPSRERIPAPTPSPAPVIVAKTPGYSGARSGRFIWTGMLGRRGVMEMDGPHASTGSVNGAFPAVPLALRVLPAEFSHDGLIIYTADPARDGMSEPPSKANGWNGTHYKFDPDRSRGLVVLESPNKTNDFTRLVVRNDGHPCSVVVVEWSVTQ